MSAFSSLRCVHRSGAVRYGGEGDGGAGCVAGGRRRRRRGARHDGGQQRRRCCLAPQLQVPEVPDHVGLGNLLRLHVLLALQHPGHRRHVRAPFRHVLRAQEPHLQEPARLVHVQVVAQGAVDDLVQLPLVVVCPRLQRKKGLVNSNLLVIP